MLANVDILQSVRIDLLRIRQMVPMEPDNYGLIYMIEMALQETKSETDGPRQRVFRRRRGKPLNPE